MSHRPARIGRPERHTRSMMHSAQRLAGHSWGWRIRMHWALGIGQLGNGHWAWATQAMRHGALGHAGNVHWAMRALGNVHWAMRALGSLCCA